MASDLMRDFRLRAVEAQALLAASRERASDFDLGLARSQTMARSRVSIDESWRVIAEANRLLAEIATP